MAAGPDMRRARLDMAAGPAVTTEVVAAGPAGAFRPSAGPAPVPAYSAGNAFAMSCANCAGNHWPEIGALGSALVGWLLLRGLPV